MQRAYEADFVHQLDKSTWIETDKSEVGIEFQEAASVFSKKSAEAVLNTDEFALSCDSLKCL